MSYQWNVNLSSEVLEAITKEVNLYEVEAFVKLLPEGEDISADVVRLRLALYSWFPSGASRDTQMRRVRKYIDAALQMNIPVCSTNKGYRLGNYDEVIEAAERSAALARGAERHQQALLAVAREMNAAAAVA